MNAKIVVAQGMTRAKRYANHAGGRKYSKVTGKELEKSVTHKDAAEKLAASETFREVWNRCRRHEGYAKRKESFLKEQKEFLKEQQNTPPKNAPQITKKNKS